VEHLRQPVANLRGKPSLENEVVAIISHTGDCPTTALIPVSQSSMNKESALEPNGRGCGRI
jgi:hypothetical protein